MANLEGVFDACVAQLNSGTPLDACLAMYPAEAAELEPALRVVLGLRVLAAPPPAMEPAAAQAARERFHARASALSQPTAVSFDEAVDQSTAMAAAGASLEECLDRFPHHAAELRPMLETLVALQQVRQPAPLPDPAERAAARRTFLAHAVALSRPSETTVEEALEASLQMIARGAPVEACLRAFPHHAWELRQALAVTGALQSELACPAPARPARDLAAQRKAFVASAQATRRSARSRPAAADWLAGLAGMFRQPGWARAAVMLLVVVFVLAFGRVAVTTAAGSLPGDPLYPVKLATEQARLLVTTDEGQRASLRQQFDQNRRAEAAEVVEQQRQVQVQFPGVIESMEDGVWRIAGMPLPVLVPGDAVLHGLPAVGARVIVLANSDGSGSLIALQVWVEVPSVLPPAAPVDTATPTFTPRVEPPTSTPTQPAPPAATDTPGARLTPTWTPLVTATFTLTPTETVTPTVTATPTPSPTTTPTRTVTPTPLPRPVTFVGAIEVKHPTWWQVDGRRVEITDETLIDESLGPAVVGAVVEVTGMLQPNQSVVAMLVRVQRVTVETDFLTDVIREMGGSAWLIGNRWVVVTGSTVIVGDPAVGKVARVSLERFPSGPWTATRIEIEEGPEPFYIIGVITSISSGSWVVRGETIVITGSTVFAGLPPQVGLIAQVEGISQGGQLIAQFINVVEPTPTPTPIHTPQPTPTSTPEATPTPTSAPEATPTPESTPEGGG